MVNPAPWRPIFDQPGIRVGHARFTGRGVSRTTRPAGPTSYIDFDPNQAPITTFTGGLSQSMEPIDLDIPVYPLSDLEDGSEGEGEGEVNGELDQELDLNEFAESHPGLSFMAFVARAQATFHEGTIDPSLLTTEERAIDAAQNEVSHLHLTFLSHHPESRLTESRLESSWTTCSQRT